MSQKLKFPLVAEQIIRKIESGEYPLNSELPTLDELTKLYQVSRMTAQRALKILSHKGYVSARRGNKTRIISLKPLERLSILRGKNIGMLADYAVLDASSVPGGAGSPMQSLYYLQKKLTDLGNHVMGFQYVDDIDLRPDDFDCYIMFDPLGIRQNLRPLLEKTGKPYVVIEVLGSGGVRHNHIQPLFTFVQMRLLSHFLKNEVSSIVIMGGDPRLVTNKKLSDEEFNHLNDIMFDRIGGWFKCSLENNGFPMENFITVNSGYHEDQAAKVTEGLLQRNKIRKKTAFITICESNAYGIAKMLKRHDWKTKDYLMCVVDPMARASHAVPGIIGVDVSLDETLAQVVESFEYQFSCNTNYAPGSVVRTVFQRYCNI
jgi:DNA-binding LacI/PurR family transcriptional regulator